MEPKPAEAIDATTGPPAVTQHRPHDLAALESELTGPRALIKDEKWRGELEPAHTTTGIAEVKLSEAQTNALLAELNEETEIEIRPDGVPYIPGVVLRERLCRAIGPGRWALKQEAMPRWDAEEGIALYDGSLWIDGKYISRAIGQCKWRPTNTNMTRLDALEGAKTDCLSRCCKDLGIGSKLWHPRYAEDWRARFCESYEFYNRRIGRSEIRWRRKGGALDAEQRIGVDDGEETGQASGSRGADEGATRSAPSEPMERGTNHAPASCPTCPKCHGPMWDNRADRKLAEADIAAGKRTRRAPPAWKCRDKNCNGVVWPSNPGEEEAEATGEPSAAEQRKIKARELRAELTGLGASKEVVDATIKARLSAITPPPEGVAREEATLDIMSVLIGELRTGGFGKSESAKE